jgi:hypothetical protein
MPYVIRQADGQIASLHRQESAEAREFLEERHPEVLAFVGGANEDDQHFTRLDADFVRVIEDVVDVLLSKHILTITDLPAEAQAKLFARKSFREKASKNSLRLFDSNFGDVI